MVVAWFLTAGPMYAQLRQLLYEPKPIIVVLTALLVVLAIGRGAPIVAIVLSVALVPAAQWYDNRFAGPPIAMAVLLGLCWAVATGGFAPPWRWWPPAPALRLMFVPLLATDVVLIVAPGLRLPAVLIAMAGAVLGLALLLPALMIRATSWLDGPLRPLSRFGQANAQLLDRLGQPIGRVFGAVAMLPAACLTLVIWLSHQLTRFDPLDHAGSSGSQWLRRQGEDVAPDRAFAALHVTRTDMRPRTAHRILAAVPLLVVIAVVSVLVRLDQVAPAEGGPGEEHIVVPEECSSPPDAAMDGQRNWPELGCETTEYSLRARFDAVTAYRFEDYEGRFVNSSDGVRPTWRPPDCGGCTRVSVWWFGGSAAWGWYQEDDWTLPSQVARLAWDQGVALDITNYAQPGWTFGQGVRKFIDLTATEEPPDVAVFYDGANDISLQRDRNFVGRGDDESEVTFAEEWLDQVLVNGGPFDWRMRRADEAPHADSPELEPRDVARHAMARYKRNLELATSFAESVGTLPIFVWQPILPFAPERIGNPGAVPPSDRANWLDMRPTISADMPDEVIDLSDSLDDAPSVVFKDFVHTNELGAEIVADALLQETLADLREPGQGSRSSGPGA